MEYQILTTAEFGLIQGILGIELAELQRLANLFSGDGREWISRRAEEVQALRWKFDAISRASNGPFRLSVDTPIGAWITPPK